MPQIRPIKDLRNTTEISQACHESSDPIFITKNGYGDMVVMSMETYERHMAELDIIRKLGEAEKDIKEGNVLDFDDAFNGLKGKYFGK